MAGPIRQPIDLQSLEKFIKQNVPEIETPLEVKQFGYGQSNPTYLLKSPNGNKYVMRKKPPGKLLSKTAHAVDREYKIIHALETTDVPIPRAMCLCEDDSVVGTPFYIMSFLDGRIFEDPAMPGVSAEDRREMWKSAVTTLAKFHRVPPKSVGLEKFGRHNGFYNRQLKTFATLSKAQASTKDIETGVPVGDIPHYDDMVAFFGQASTQPKDRSTFVHGDYKIDNVVFHKTEPRVIGILDWEMATIGHPWSDLTNLLMPFTTSESAKAKSVGRSHAGFVRGATPGLPTKEECVKWYEETSGMDVPPSELTWAEAFGTYRGAIIMQGIAARYAVRQASSANAKDYAVQMKPFGLVAWDFVQAFLQQTGSKSKL
ncbi:putative acyl-coa dehydrogenase ibr3 [Acrodontium crateriforme]|uniref:Acyl-coa dehydrogenase ibr3 n=1 Tax=Acrodontium crateriforme TaxID=150365 RepID=A0AAQ3R610_9PEZI|nr:putative acyl-coa dehydrogenase ibr3 [Acrodontium crateriforme]